MQTASEIQFPNRGWLGAWIKSIGATRAECVGAGIPEDERERSEDSQARIHESQREQRFTQRTPDEPPF